MYTYILCKKQNKYEIKGNDNGLPEVLFGNLWIAFNYLKSSNKPQGVICKNEVLDGGLFEGMACSKRGRIQGFMVY